MTDLRRPGPLSERLEGLRVGYVGHRARRWLGTRVADIEISPDWEPGVEAERWIDVLVVDEDSARTERLDLHGVLDAARVNGMRTVGFVSGKRSRLAHLVDLPVGPFGSAESGAVIELPPLVDLTTVSPIGGVGPCEDEALVAMRSRPRWTPNRSFRSFEKLLELETPYHSGSHPSLVLRHLDRSLSIAPALPNLRHSLGVVDDRSLHRSIEDRSEYLAQLAVAGVPLRLLDDAATSLEPILGPGLTQSTRGPIGDLLDADERERISVRQRRLALERFTDWGRWETIANRLGISLRPRPTVSVLLSTNRPAQLEHALRQIAIQDYQPIEPIVVLHGDGFGDDAEPAVAERCPHARTLRVSTAHSLGDALNAGVAAATGDLVTKMDDDDWYGAEHVTDLVQAMEYSGAELIGKAAEWVYLEELDVTMRRFATGAESGSATLAGGTMMMRRADLLSVGGFRRARRHVDLGLIEDVNRLGGRHYRTHGFGYLLNRSAGGHTWDMGVEYFLEQSTTQIRGRSWEAAMVRGDTPRTQAAS